MLHSYWLQGGGGGADGRGAIERLFQLLSFYRFTEEGVAYCLSLKAGRVGGAQLRPRAPVFELLLAEIEGVALQCLRLHLGAEFFGGGAQAGAGVLGNLEFFAG